MSRSDGLLVLCVASYVVGSIPFSAIVARLAKGIDLRREGSGNVGAANVLALAGWPAAIMALLGDVGKGAAVVLLAQAATGSRFVMLLSGLAAIAGHNWPIFLGFRGGKGIATSTGVLLVTFPRVLAPMAGIWFTVMALTGYVSLGPVVAFLSLPGLMWWLGRHDALVFFGVACATMVVYQHMTNVERIFWGIEPRLGKKVDVDRLEEEVGFRSRRKFVSRLALVLMMALGFSLWLFNRYVYRGFGMQVGVIRAGSPDFKLVALTFDDGPDPEYTPEVLDILKRYGVTATFFLVGKHVEKHPDLARRITEEGHELGNHSYSHRNLLAAGKEIVLHEVVKGEEAIGRATGKRVFLFRPPRGMYSGTLTSVLRERKYTLVLWSLSGRDWAELSPHEIASRILQRLRNGDILLLHDSGNLISSSGGSRNNTVRALPALLEGIQARGYRFVTVSELIFLSGMTDIPGRQCEGGQTGEEGFLKSPLLLSPPLWYNTVWVTSGFWGSGRSSAW